MHVYEIRPRKDKRGIDLISDVLPFAKNALGVVNVLVILQPFSGRFPLRKKK